jgi:uncharacterized protein (DUF488 family)
MASPVLWTIGHSNHEPDRFVDLVMHAQIGYIVDVRSHPYSRYAPHFNREELDRLLSHRGVGYLFLGDALGGRPDDDHHYDADGHALYAPMAALPAFQRGIERILRGAVSHRLGLMCSCGQPQDCHRRLLVGKVLCEHGAELRHILPDGDVMTEHRVDLNSDGGQHSLFDEAPPWRSVRPIAGRRWLSTASPAS